MVKKQINGKTIGVPKESSSLVALFFLFIFYQSSHVPLPEQATKAQLSAETPTNAMKRVMKHKGNNASYCQGIYLSNTQLQELGRQLAAISNGPDGVVFMIGKGSNSNTVEIIPFKKEEKIKFYKKSNVLGAIDVKIPNIQAGGVGMVIDGNGIHPVPNPAAHVAITNPNQKTPPPFPE